MARNNEDNKNMRVARARGKSRGLPVRGMTGKRPVPGGKVLAKLDEGGAKKGGGRPGAAAPSVAPAGAVSVAETLRGKGGFATNGLSNDHVQAELVEMERESTREEEVQKRKPSKMLLVLAAMGPGIVTAMAGNDAGGISTYSTAGAQFGFSTLWVIPIMCVLLILVETTAGRMGAVTGKDLRRSFASGSASA